MKEGLLLDPLALRIDDVTPRNVEPAIAVETHLADSGMAGGNRASMSTGGATHPIAVDRLPQVAYSNILVQELSKCFHSRTTLEGGNRGKPWDRRPGQQSKEFLAPVLG